MFQGPQEAQFQGRINLQYLPGSEYDTEFMCESAEMDLHKYITGRRLHHC